MLNLSVKQTSSWRLLERHLVETNSVPEWINVLWNPKFWQETNGIKTNK